MKKKEIEIKKLIQEALWKYGKYHYSDTRHSGKNEIFKLSFFESILELIQLVKEINEIVESEFN